MRGFEPTQLKNSEAGKMNGCTAPRRGCNFPAGRAGRGGAGELGRHRPLPKVLQSLEAAQKPVRCSGSEPGDSWGRQA